MDVGYDNGCSSIKEYLLNLVQSMNTQDRLAQYMQFENSLLSSQSSLNKPYSSPAF